jgi:mono/diheme cytochrome c family protein
MPNRISQFINSPERFWRCAGILVCVFFGFALADCQSTSFVPPPVTPQMASAVKKRQQVDLVTLQAGRTLFVSRCIECHTLPVVSRYDAVAWPWLVDDMAARASLKPAEREALVAYILAARAQAN